MPRKMRVTLELGPKGKKVVAVAPDWPGLERGGPTAEAATEKLWSYVPRYTEVAGRAGLGDELGQLRGVDVVEEYEGTGSTDFWGISFGFSSLDSHMTGAELARQLELMRACWSVFDDVRARVSPEMQKGPRGGGRDRDEIARHVVFTEQSFAKKLGIVTPEHAIVTDEGALFAFRSEYCKKVMAFHKEKKAARTWPLRYLLRHTAYHAMDHIWEMEDKDLSRSATA